MSAMSDITTQNVKSSFDACMIGDLDFIVESSNYDDAMPDVTTRSVRSYFDACMSGDLDFIVESAQKGLQFIPSEEPAGFRDQYINHVLAESGNNLQVAGLLAAIHNRQPRIVEFLMGDSAPNVHQALLVSGSTLWKQACKINHAETMQTLSTALATAARRHNLAIMESLNRIPEERTSSTSNIV